MWTRVIEVGLALGSHDPADPTDPDEDREDSLIGGCSYRYNKVRQVVCDCPLLFPYLGNCVEDYSNEAHVYEINKSAYLVSDIGPTEPAVSILQASFRRFCTQLLGDCQDDGFGDLYERGMMCDESDLFELCFKFISGNICHALSFLHENLLCHGILSPEDIIFDWISSPSIKFLNARLSGYALGYISGQSLVKKGMVKYASPEILCLDPRKTGAYIFLPKSDVWSLGMILAELVGLVEFESEEDHVCVLDRLLQEKSCGLPVSFASLLIKKSKLALDPDFVDFLTRCLYIHPNDRDSAQNLLKHPFVCGAYVPTESRQSLWCLQDDSRGGNNSSNLYFQFRSGSNWYHQITRRPREGVEWGLHEVSNRVFFEDVSVTKEIQGILETEDNSSLNKVLDEDDSVSVISSLPSLPEKSPKKGSNIFAAFAFVNAATGGGGASPKSLTTEKIALRDQVLDPFMRVVPKIIQAMRSANMHYDNVAYRCEVADWMLKVVFDYRDIQLSTSFRALSWVSLLDVYLEPADRNSPADPFAGGPIRVAATSELQYRLLQSRIGVEHQIDRQLLQDVPRCHQYHLLMRCTESRSTLRNVLKTWTLANPGSEYWQGLDSIAAAVVCIFNGNEPTIFAVFNKIIQTYLPGMFSSIKNKNSKLLHARLCVLEQLLAFHDPQLGLHLKDLGVKPDLYAIPWVLTLFSHVLPLPILCKLWDYLFLEAPEDRGATILFFSVSVLVQLRKTLFQLDDFGTCVGFLTRLPVRLDELVSRSIVLAEKVKVLTPKFLGLGVAPVFFDEENNVPIIPATELVKHWDETVVVETGEDILIREAIKFHEASVLDKVNALLVKDVKKRIVVFHNTDHDYQKLVSFLKIFFLGEKRPFLCVLEADALSTVEDIAPHLLDPDKVDRDVIEL